MSKPLFFVVVVFSIFAIGLAFILIRIAGGSPSTRPDSRTNSTRPIEKTKTQPELEVLGKCELQSGLLYSYKVNNDTIYIIQGKNSSYPVSMQVK